MAEELLSNDHQLFIHAIRDGNQEKEISCYQGGSFVSKGGFGRCYIARKYKGIHNNEDPNHIGQVVIIKTMQKQVKHNSQRAFINEVNILNILKATRSQYFVNIYESWQDQNNYYIVLEKGDLSLHELVASTGQLNENEVLFIIQQILRALLVLHRQRIIHKDIKPQNIIMNTEASIKLIDFGLSKIDLDNDPKDWKRSGTPIFFSPQLIVATDRNQYSYQVDIWSAGISLYFLMNKKYPYDCKNNEQAQKLLKAKIIPFTKQLAGKSKHVTPQKRKSFQLLQKMLIYDKKNRPTVEDLLRDHFFDQINDNQDLEMKIRESLKKKIQLYLKKKHKEIKWTKDIVQTSVILQNKLLRDHSNTRVIVRKLVHQSEYGHFFYLSNGSKFAYFNDETILRHGKVCNLSDSQEVNKKNILQKIVKQKFNDMTQISNGEQTFIVKIVKTKQALFVRLSNHTFQVFFVQKLAKNQQRLNEKTNLQYSCGVYMNYSLLNPAEIGIVNFIQDTQQQYLNFQEAKKSSEHRNKLNYINTVMQIMLDNSQNRLQNKYQRVHS